MSAYQSDVVPYSYKVPINPILLSIKNSKRIINLQGTKYPIIKKVALQQLKFQLGIDFYIFLWTDYPLSIREIRELDQTKRVNHLPEISQITRKNKLGRNLNAMQYVIPKSYDFYPETWMLPIDHHKIVKKHKKNKFYIVKPQNSCQGKGIFLIQNPFKLDKGISCIVQEYVNNPFLIEGLKFDIRIYVLITSICPLRVFLYKQGLARFATQLFQKPEHQNLENAFCHLTNYAINKNNSKFIVDNDNFSSGHKRALTSVLANEEIFGVGYVSIFFQKVADIVIKTVISALPSLQNAYQQCKKYDPNSCFQLLGFDIMLNEDKKLFLLEVNQNPSLVTDTAVDMNIKTALVKNILEMVSGGLPINSQEKLQTKIRNKDAHQRQTIGNFTRIYPCATLDKTQSYDIMIKKSEDIYKEKFGINKKSFRTKIVQKQAIENVDISKQQPSPYLPQWNQGPKFYSKAKLTKVYRTRMTKTSQPQKRKLLE